MTRVPSGPGLPQESEPLPFHVEHIVARQRGGPDSSENLLLLAPTAISTKERTCRVSTRKRATNPAFHPRADKWEKHFDVAAGIVRGLTPPGGPLFDC